MGDTVLIVVAHPDDEVLGVGGTVAWHAARDDVVHSLILGEGEASRGTSTRVARRRQAGLRQAAAKAAAELGAQEPLFRTYPDNRFDTVPLLSIVQDIEKTITAVRPTIVYTHHSGDLNVDHRVTYAAVLTACRPQPASLVRTMLTFETVSSSEWGAAFQPRLFIDIEKHLGTKRRALAHYRAEMRAFPHARSLENVEALARHRGATAGLKAAEAFDVVRSILV